jgi:putative transposase
VAGVSDHAGQGVTACDFVHIDLVDLRRVYALVFLEHGTRRLRIAAVTTHPTGPWATQQARELAVKLGVRLDSLCFLIRDRDARYTESFDAVFEPEDMETITTPPRAPRANAHRERVIGTLRREALDHMLLWSETHARHGLEIYTRHYNGHRPHQASGQLPPLVQQHPAPIADSIADHLRRTRVLGDVINEYRYTAEPAAMNSERHRHVLRQP